MELRWKFVAQAPEGLAPGHRGLALDVGARSPIPGIEYFTHHGEAQPHDPGFGRSSTALLLDGIERLAPWRRTPEPVTVFCHVQPDLDCFAASYLAWAYLQEPAGDGERLWEQADFEQFRRRLADAVNGVDQGEIRPAVPDRPETWVNLYTLALFLDVHLKDHHFGFPESRPRYLSRMGDRARTFLPGCSLDWRKEYDPWVGAALCLIHALRLADPGGTFLVRSGAGFPSLHPYIERARARFGATADAWVADLLEAVAATARHGLEAAIGYLDRGEFFEVRVPGEPETQVLGVVQTVSANIAGTVAKLYRGYRPPAAGGQVWLTAIPIAEDTTRVVISVPPGMSFTLRGLGLALHRANMDRGCPRTDRARFCRKMSDGRVVADPLFPHEDPWYDGRDRNFTIVDAPRDVRFRRLDPDTVRDVLRADWRRLAPLYDTPAYREWLKGALVPCP